MCFKLSTRVFIYALMASFNSCFLFCFGFVFFSSAQVPDNDEQFVPDYQAESCKYTTNHHFLKVNIFVYPCLHLCYLFCHPWSCDSSFC